MGGGEGLVWYAFGSLCLQGGEGWQVGSDVPSTPRHALLLACRKRHNEMHHLLWDGLKSLGLKSFVEKDEDRLITVNTIKVRFSFRQLMHEELASSAGSWGGGRLQQAPQQ